MLTRLFRGKMLAMLMDAHDSGQMTFFNTHAGLAEKRTFKRFIAVLRRLLTHKSSRISRRTPYVCCFARARAAAPARS